MVANQGCIIIIFPYDINDDDDDDDAKAGTRHQADHHIL